MIYTVTLNPSVDYYMDFVNPAFGTLNRSKSESFAFGGKGINVSRMLKSLGMESCAVAAAGGFTGSALAEGLKAEGIRVKPIAVEGATRINVKLPAAQTEFNAAGPKGNSNTLSELNAALNEAVKGDIVILSGSICRGINKNIYAELTHKLNNKGIITAVDADGELLKAAVKAKPFLLKPNLEELGRLFNTQITDIELAKAYGKRLLDMGVENALISMSSRGALLVNKEWELYASAPRIKAVNTVGAGDCLLAGFIYGTAKGFEPEGCLKLAVACGSAKTAAGNFPNKDSVMEFYDKI